MKLHPPVFAFSAFAAPLFAATMACTAAHGAQTAAAAEAQEQYRQELAVCNSGASPEGRTTCLRETRAAYAQQLRSGLQVGNANYASNASLRCQALEGNERAACVTRIQGGGTTTGSVAGGGILRELVTRTTVMPPPAPEMSR